MNIKVHSKKAEADYSKSHVRKDVADAYALLDDYFCNEDGSLRKDSVDQIMTTFVNERDLVDRSKSKANKSHSLAWDAQLRVINAYLEWDDETPHSTSLTSDQVKNWFKLKGRDFKEDLKPLVSAIDTYRGKAESKMAESDTGARKALAKELGVPVRNVKESSKDYDYLGPDNVLDVKMKDGETATYCVYNDEQSAYDAAVDDLESQFRDDYAILGAAIEYFGNDTFLDFVDADGEYRDEIEGLADDLGKAEFARYVQEQVATTFNVNYRGFAEYTIDRLDPAWHLAIYDSKEVGLDNGMLAYRVD